MARSSSLQQSRTYPSNVDPWLAVLLWLAVAALAAFVIWGWAHAGWLQALQRTVIVGAGAGFIIWVLLGTNYTLTEDHLVVRAGPLFRRIPVKDITSIAAESGVSRMRTSPALSMDRLQVTYGRGKQVLISPADRDRFLKDIAARGAKV